MEYLYALYLLSGIIKAFLNFFNVSSGIDFTLLMGSLLLAGLLFDVLIKRVFNFDAKYVVSICMFLIFFLWLNITILYSPSFTYSYQKSFFFLTNILAFVIPLLYKKFNYIKFFRFLIILAPTLGALFLIFFSQTVYTSTYAAEAIEGLYLSMPEFCGLCVIVLIVFRELFPPLFNGLFIILNSLVVILAGGRGPLVTVAVVLIIYFIATFFSNHISLRKNKYALKLKSFNMKRFFLVTITTSIVLSLLITFVPDIKILFDRSYERLMSLFEFILLGLEDESSTVRINLFILAYNLIFDNVKAFFFGYGLGSFGILSGMGDIRLYPHNIILEIWVETGLIGVLLFSIFLIYTYGRHIKANPFTWLVLYVFFNAMKSSALEDLRLFFGLLALLLYSRTVAVSWRSMRVVKTLGKKSSYRRWFLPKSV